MRKHLLTAALLAPAAVSAAQLVVSIRQHRERAHLATAEIHQKLLTEQVADPSLMRVWSRLEPLSDEERRLIVHRNQWMSLWGLQHRVGVFTGQALRETVHDFMANPQGRAFWKLARDHREGSARDRTDRRFNKLITEACYEAHEAAEDSASI
ncbi:DUF6082 family protein [Streptomyces sp. NPDC003016]